MKPQNQTKRTLLDRPKYQSLLVLAATIILSEIFAHSIASLLFVPHDTTVILIIHSALLLLILIPSLYYFFYKAKTDLLEELITTKESNNRLDLMVANSSIMLFNLRVKKGPSVHTEWASDNIGRILGYSEQELYESDWWFSHIHPQDKSKVITQSGRLVKGHHDHYTYEYRFQHKDGSYIWIHDEQKLEFDDQGNLSNIICFWKDITEKKVLEMELTIAAHAFESREAIMITDADLHILKVNNTFEKITGYNAATIAGKTPVVLQSGKHDAEFYDEIWQSINQFGFWQGEIWDKTYSGEIFPAQMSITAIKDHNEKITNYIAIFNDITQRKIAENETRVAANYDLLTSLPNRRLLFDRLERAILSTSRTNQYAAALFLDLDNFKALNDSYGHHVGDQFLQKVASRLISCVRETDTLARFGGDEFIILLSGLNTKKDKAAAEASQLAEKICSALAKPYNLAYSQDDREEIISHDSSASIGLVLFSDHKVSSDHLIKLADEAMYKAKYEGGNTFFISYA